MKPTTSTCADYVIPPAYGDTMATPSNSLFMLTASDLMSRKIFTIPHDLSLHAAAQVLFEHHVGGAPVVDGDGRCIGMLTATDFIHWVNDGAKGVDEAPLPACPYQVKGRLLSGEDAVICTLAEGSCPLQEMRPSTGGRHMAVCLQPHGIVNDWQQVIQKLPVSGVRRYMTVDVVTVAPDTPLPELARTMINTHVHRLLVVDDQHRPIGIVSSIDLLGALAKTSSPAMDPPFAHTSD